MSWKNSPSTKASMCLNKDTHIQQQTRNWHCLINVNYQSRHSTLTEPVHLPKSMILLNKVH